VLFKNYECRPTHMRNPFILNNSEHMTATEWGQLCKIWPYLFARVYMYTEEILNNSTNYNKIKPLKKGGKFSALYQLAEWLCIHCKRMKIVQSTELKYDDTEDHKKLYNGKISSIFNLTIKNLFLRLLT
jgi:hypothetical protein